MATIEQEPPPRPGPAPERRAVQVHAVCPHDCPDTCAMHVTVEDGRVTRVEGDPTHPVTRGFLCVKVNQYVEHVYSPRRVLTPRKRVGPKGSGRFVEIGTCGGDGETVTVGRETER